MTLLKESYLHHLLLLLLAAYEDSGLHRLAVRAGAWCGGQIDGSALLRPLCREGVLARSWPCSGACRLLSWIVNLPGRLLRRFYLLLEETFADSFFARLAFRLGDETAVAEGWLILLLWIIPYEYWNNAYTLLAFLTLLLLLHAGAMGRGDRHLDVERTGFFPALFFAAVVLGVVFSLTRNVSVRFFVYHLSAALCVVVTVSALRSAEELKRLAAGASGCVAVSSLYAIFQRLSGLEVNTSYVDMDLNADMPSRVMSFFDNPNTFAEVLLLLMPLTLALILCSRHIVSKLAASAAFVLGGAAMGMTYCRAAWIGMACAMVVMIFLWKPKLLPLFFALCVLAAPFLPASIWNRVLTIFDSSDSSTNSRFPLFKAGLEVIVRRPLSGAGLGTAAVQRYVKLLNFYHARTPFVHSHNTYLQVWAELGILGFVGFVGSALWGVKRAAHAVRHCGNSAARTITCAACAALCGSLVCGLADYLWNYPRVMCIFWFVFALALGGVKLCGENA
ncbi:O-antigen ligase family protein [uncultured Oscillibacter sp.]|uniref:O-antigen ligase family protein n=1 Tax=uncultured Oscillibacter sp. TaxID=876091 RepID=UPI0025EB147D|nr:O-antigen ligase family protein [uncultured Oscillibacter sp.]